MIYQLFFAQPRPDPTHMLRCDRLSCLPRSAFCIGTREADFKPKPNRPRSIPNDSARFCSLPYFIASNSSSDDIPWPSSQIATYKFWGVNCKSYRDPLGFSAYAIINYIGDRTFKEYPMARMDNMRISAVGLFSRRLFILISPFCRFYSALYNYDSICSVL